MCDVNLIGDLGILQDIMVELHREMAFKTVQYVKVVFISFLMKILVAVLQISF